MCAVYLPAGILAIIIGFQCSSLLGHRLHCPVAHLYPRMEHGIRDTRTSTMNFPGYPSMNTQGALMGTLWRCLLFLKKKQIKTKQMHAVVMSFNSWRLKWVLTGRLGILDTQLLSGENIILTAPWMSSLIHHLTTGSSLLLHSCLGDNGVCWDVADHRLPVQVLSLVFCLSSAILRPLIKTSRFCARAA
jgi:hypothetical protein